MNKHLRAIRSYSALIVLAVSILPVIALPAVAASSAPHRGPQGSGRVSASGAAVAANPRNFHMPQAMLMRQIEQLERAKHLLELSAANDHASHSGVAARHIQMAINELKLELQQKAKESAAASGGGPTPAARRN